MIKIAGLIVVAALSSPVWACRLSPQSPWKATKEKLVTSTKTIALAQAQIAPIEISTARGTKAQYKFKVLKVLKGDPALQEFTIIGEPEGSLKDRVTYDTDCSLMVTFEPSKFYLVFMDSVHPEGYRELSTVDHPWIKEVEKMIEASNKSKPKARKK